MKKISASYIFPGNSSPIKNGVIELDDTGTILRVFNPEFDNIEWGEVEQFEGVICPGFVNTHCHLELSYLKGKIAEKSKLVGFIKEIIAIRETYTDEERAATIKDAEQEMIRNGIVAVGDISNGESTFKAKELSPLKYHTFIEVFGSDPKVADASFTYTKNLYDKYFIKNRASLTPHATYSVSDKLSPLINQHNIDNNSIISIHNQETESENTFFKEGKGDLYEFLDIDKKTENKFLPTKKNALASFLENYTGLNRILLVHNTFTNKEDINWAKNYSNNIFWCFCPNANLYIENRLPNFKLFINEKCTIGTDSLASNWELSILNELKVIAKSTPEIPLEILIKWATANGAAFLGFKELGSIEPGKAPGLNLIENIDLESLVLKTSSTVKRLI